MSGRSTCWGWGWKVTTPAALPFAAARSMTRRSSATCPRCTPSKTPMVTVVGRCAATRRNSARVSWVGTASPQPVAPAAPAAVAAGLATISMSP